VRAAGGGPVAVRGPLSTTQNTRFAEAYGSAVITWSTSAVKGLIRVDGPQRPMTFSVRSLLMVWLLPG
jgi:hypothetical protein